MTVMLKHLQALLILSAMTVSYAFANNTNQESPFIWSVVKAYENFNLRTIPSSLGQTLKFVCGNNTVADFFAAHSPDEIVASTLNEQEGFYKLETKSQKIGLLAFVRGGENFLGFVEESTEGTRSESIFLVEYDLNLDLWVATIELISESSYRTISLDDWIREPKADSRTGQKCALNLDSNMIRP